MLNRLFVLGIVMLFVSIQTINAHRIEHRWGSDSSHVIQYPIVISCKGEDPENPFAIRLGQRLIVKVHNLDSLMQIVENAGNIVLVLDDVRLDGIRAYNVNTWTGDVHFRLTLEDYSEANQRAWAMVVGAPAAFSKFVSVSVADAASGRVLPTAVSKRHRITRSGVIQRDPSGSGYSVKLVHASSTRIGVAGILTLGIAVLLWFAGSKTNMLRVATMQPFDNAKGQWAPYSLALVQMAFWYIIVVVSSIYLWILTEQYIPFPNSVLGILGISTVTGLTAMSIDHHREKRLAEDVEHPYSPSRGIIRDLVSDATGTAALQRIQILVWTLLFGIYYLHDVYRTVSIPDIDNSMLVLMGFTSSAYVGGKLIDPGATK